ncbi:MAG: hypothetical protein QM736_25200 [Vicinamibacterales bacterium]
MFVVAVAIGFRDVAPALAVVVGTSAAAVVVYGLASRALQARLTPRADADVTTSAVSGGRCINAQHPHLLVADRRLESAHRARDAG